MNCYSLDISWLFLLDLVEVNLIKFDFFYMKLSVYCFMFFLINSCRFVIENGIGCLLDRNYVYFIRLVL